MLIGKGVDEPVVSHDEPGATDHSIVLNGMFCLIGSCRPFLGLSPRVDMNLVIVFI